MEKAETRRHLRVYWAVRATITTNSGKKIEIETVDVGLGGMRFIAKVPLEIDEQVFGELPLPDGADHKIEGTVVERKGKNPYKLHVAFTDTTMQELAKRNLEI